MFIVVWRLVLMIRESAFKLKIKVSVPILYNYKHQPQQGSFCH